MAAQLNQISRESYSGWEKLRRSLPRNGHSHAAGTWVPHKHRLQVVGGAANGAAATVEDGNRFLLRDSAGSLADPTDPVRNSSISIPIPIATPIGAPFKGHQ